MLIFYNKTCEKKGLPSKKNSHVIQLAQIFGIKTRTWFYFLKELDSKPGSRFYLGVKLELVFLKNKKSFLKMYPESRVSKQLTMSFNLGLKELDCNESWLWESKLELELGFCFWRTGFLISFLCATGTETETKIVLIFFSLELEQEVLHKSKEPSNMGLEFRHWKLQLLGRTVFPTENLFSLWIFLVPCNEPGMAHSHST